MSALDLLSARQTGGGDWGLPQKRFDLSTFNEMCTISTEHLQTLALRNEGIEWYLRADWDAINEKWQHRLYFLPLAATVAVVAQHMLSLRGELTHQTALRLVKSGEKISDELKIAVDVSLIKALLQSDAARSRTLEGANTALLIDMLRVADKYGKSRKYFDITVYERIICGEKDDNLADDIQREFRALFNDYIEQFGAPTATVNPKFPSDMPNGVCDVE